MLKPLYCGPFLFLVRWPPKGTVAGKRWKYRVCRYRVDTYYIQSRYIVHTKSNDLSSSGRRQSRGFESTNEEGKIRTKGKINREEYNQ